MYAYLLICGDMYWRKHFLLSGLHHGQCNACTVVWNTVKASCRSEQ
jgi:hypothetical protein